jgi:hypothetical protein
MSKTRWILPGALVLLLTATFAWSQNWPIPTRIVTELSGDQVVGSVPTSALGKVYFDVRSEGQLDYRVSVTGIRGITGIYVHEGKHRGTGPVIARLYVPDRPTDRLTGTVVEGTLTDANLTDASRDRGVSYVIDQLMNNNAYVQITTEDYPNGFIRGTIPYPYN